MPTDAGAFDSLLAEHGALLARVAATYERDPGAREELLQEIALAVWRAWPSFRGECAPRTFLARIAHHRAVSHVARSARRRESPWEVASPAGVRSEARDEQRDPIDPVDPAPTPEAAALAAERSEALFRAVRDLPLPQRQTVSLVLEGFSHREVGEALGMTENHVAVTVHRAKESLRRAMGARGAR
jgi:RNA polymerase sigma-70 factor (ECF subfamily)